MRQQLTLEAIMVLAGGVILFWVSIVALVRQHGNRARSRASRRATETRG